MLTEFRIVGDPNRHDVRCPANIQVISGQIPAGERLVTHIVYTYSMCNVNTVNIIIRYIYIYVGVCHNYHSYTKSADPSEWQGERMSGAALFLQKAPL